MRSRSHFVVSLAALAIPVLAQGDGQVQAPWNGEVITVTLPGPVVTIHKTVGVPGPLPTTLISTTSKFSSATGSSPRIDVSPSSSIAVDIPATTLTPTPSPVPTGAGRGEGIGGGAQTFSIVNSYSVALSLAFDSNAGGPDPMGGKIAPTTIGAGSTTFYSFPTGWAGRILVGKTTDAANSKIEGSVTGLPDMDVSYVDGYSVPIVCTSAGKVSGCSTELFGLNGNTCNQNVDISEFEICTNPARGLDKGPADAFFAPCQGKAYTYPKDDGANYSGVDAITNCCIGTACPMGSGSKRSIHSKREARVHHGHQIHHKARSPVHQLVQDFRFER